MKAIRSVLAATDFSEESGYAVERAGIVAAEHQARLTLLHVISESLLRDLRSVLPMQADLEERLIEDARARLRQEAADVQSLTGVGAAALVKTGAILDEIQAASDSSDVLVLGARGDNPLRHLVLGTTAERLLRTCKRPMLVIKRRPRGGYRHVIVPVDFSPHSLSALAHAGGIGPTAALTVVHAFRVPFESRLRIAGASDDVIERYCAEVRHGVEKRFRDLIGEAGADAHRISCTAEHGDPSLVILTKAAELDADLIAIGKHGQSRLQELLLGSVTRHILWRASCDVLVVPG